MFTYCGNNPVGNKDITGARYIDAMSIASETNKQRHTSCQLEGIRDVTTEINEALAKAVDEAESYVYSKNLFSVLAAYYHFYTLVDHDADWDIKRSDNWKKTIGTPFPGEGTITRYHGVLMTPEMLGNYTYGYLGRAYDIPLQVLIAGSYAAADFPSEGKVLENEVWDWNDINFGYWMAEQNCV